MGEHILGGAITALVTPFADGEIDEPALRRLVEWQIEQGSNGLVPVGTTGETPTLSHSEHERVVKLVVETAAGRIPIIAGAGSNSTEEATGLIRFAEAVGADAALVVTPYYNKPNPAGLVAHFTALHNASNLPIIIYNIPGRSVIDMKPDTMATLAKLPRIVGVKDATGDVVRVSEQRAQCGADFIQLSGEDASALGFNAHGGTGCISVTGNAAPGLCSAFQAACARGDYAAAIEIQDRLMPLHKALFVEPNPCPVKYALSLLGLCREDVRLPLAPVSADTRAQVRAALVYAGLLAD